MISGTRLAPTTFRPVAPVREDIRPVPPATWLRRRLALDVGGRRRTGVVVTQRCRAGGTAQLVVALESAEGLPAGHAIVDVPLDPPADLAADRHATVAAAGQDEAFFLETA